MGVTLRGGNGGGANPFKSRIFETGKYITSVIQEVHVCTSDGDFRWQDSEREESVQSGTNSATIAPIAHWIQPVIESV